MLATDGRDNVDGESITAKAFELAIPAQVPISSVQAMTNEHGNWGDGTTELDPPAGSWPCGKFIITVWHQGERRDITADDELIEAYTIEGVSSGCAQN